MRRKRRAPDWGGIAASIAAGLGAGLMAGLVAAELLGNVHPERVRRVVRRLGDRSPPAPLDDPAALEAAVHAALREHHATRDLDLRARALGDGLVELTGRAPDPTTHRLAGQAARGVAGARVVVNRVLVEESAPPARRAGPGSAP